MTMSTRADQEKADLIAKVAGETVRLPPEQAATVARFIRDYYAHVPPRDLLDQKPGSLYGAALSLWKFAAVRKPGQARLRAYNPRLETDGWHSEHTVIEIVNDDMPFLVDSVNAALNGLDLTVHLIIHPIIASRRDAKGRLLGIADGGDGAILESFMHVEVAGQPDNALGPIAERLASVLADVRATVEDWQPMRARARDIIASIDAQRDKTGDDDADEVSAFLQWLHDEHFTFIGFRDHDLEGRGKARTLKPRADSGLGILRDPARAVFEGIGEESGGGTSPLMRALVEQPDLLFITKADIRSPVHRPVHLDVIGIKRHDERGRVVGQRIFVGLFTSAAYNRSPRAIPLLRRKLEKTLARSEFPPASHDGKALLNILETYPRDELLQVSAEHLYRTCIGILNLQERQRVAAFFRADGFGRFMSVLIYIPRDRYTYMLRQRMRAILERTFDAEMGSFKAELGDSPLVRLHMMLRTRAGVIPAYDADALEAELIEAARSWADLLEGALNAACGEVRGQHLWRRYADAFPTGYQERFGADVAVGDVDLLEETLAKGQATLNLYRPIEAAEHEMRLKIYHPDRPVPLSDVLPMLEDMGLRVIDEVPHAIHPRDAAAVTVMIHDLGLETADRSPIDVGAVRAAFHDCFERVWRGEIESDGFNGLVLRAGLHWREVVVLRTYCKYLRQAGITFSQDYMERTMIAHPALAGGLVRLFLARFDPSGGGQADAVRAAIVEGLEAVQSADEDRILRRFLNVIDCTLRTNYFQTDADGQPKPYLAVKFDSRRIDELPLPKPLREIFVCSPRMEGVHLRFGLVARGGMRWSDRREDFRTEILGLVKAQHVKNTVIVPVGSKGGFVLKQPPAPSDRDAFLQEGVACYRILVSGMLDITDNLVGDKVVPPANVVRYDGNDPYLVVAADKGTATFSDYANELSLRYGFWLGDAFASGGSQGYDHKKMAITARGAWESVKRHFREIGVDTQSQDFSCVGVGDMSGDVFGNGMLQSPHIKLLGAFNHLHIFVDPDPDAARTLAERQRLFDLPRSSWADFDARAISKGGGVFPRSAKSIRLTPEIKARFAIAADSLTPNELIRVLLGAEVDLLFFGGIGTYVKASSESQLDAGDRGNDAVRLNGNTLRCRVVGEGANLGFTQRGRIEYALAGGRLNTDFIDNSAGVDTSDHEVNIKVLLDSVVTAGDMTAKQRNQLLIRMTDEVAALVLRDNYQQTQAISLARARGRSGFDNHIRLMRMLEKGGHLDRAVEFLPDEEAVAERLALKQSLTRPEISVAMSYAKIWLYDQLLDSDLPDDPFLVDDLVTYFPTPLGQKYRGAIESHRLRREIIATKITNSLVNRAGETFVSEFMERTGMAAADIARAYTISRQVFAFRDLWGAIEALDNRVPADVQTRMLLDINHLLEWVTLWFLRNGRRPLDIGAYVQQFGGGMAELAASLNDVLPSHYRDDVAKRAQPYIDHGVPEDLALRVAGLVNLFSGCDIVRLANRRKLKVADVARLYFATGTRFRLGRLRAAAVRLDTRSHWENLAVDALVEEIYGHQLTLAAQVMDDKAPNADPQAAIQGWVEANKGAVDRAEQVLAELWSTEITDVSMIAVASRQLRALADAATDR